MKLKVYMCRRMLFKKNNYIYLFPMKKLQKFYDGNLIPAKHCWHLLKSQLNV